jgi:hypothetical protein
MEKKGYFLLVLLFSIIHVHMSINTQDNGLNPLTFIVLLDSRTLWISEKEAFFFGGILIQSIVTMGLASFLIKWKNYPMWIADIILCIFIGWWVEETINIKTQTTDKLNSFYNWLYDTELSNLGNYALLFSTIQIILLIFYPFGLFLFRKLQRQTR